MENFQTFTIEQIASTLLEATDKTWIEVSLNGQSFRMQLGTLYSYIKNKQTVTQQASKAYWLSLPAYSVDDQAQTITIQAGGKIQQEAEQINASARTLSFNLVADPDEARFDAVVFSLANRQYEIIVGEASQNPVFPTYNQQTQLLLTYLLVDPVGSQVQAPVNDHVQNTDQYLDQGGANMVSAEELKELYTRLENYIGYKPTEADLPSPLTLDSFALVGSPIAIWVYDVETNLWSKPAGDAAAGTKQTAISFFSTTKLIDFYPQDIEVQVISVSAGIATVSYSTDGTNFTTLTLPLTAPFTLPADTEITWQISFAAGKNQGVLIINYQENAAT